MAGLLAALVVGAGCGPYPLQPSQTQAYPAQPYPPPAWGTQAPVQPRSQGSVDLGEVEDRIWRFTNDVRRQYGLPPVGREGALSRVSQAYSADMLVRRFFSHTNPEGLTAGERLKAFYSGPIYGWGENIWEGSGPVRRRPRGPGPAHHGWLDVQPRPPAEHSLPGLHPPGRGRRGPRPGDPRHPTIRHAAASAPGILKLLGICLSGSAPICYDLKK